MLLKTCWFCKSRPSASCATMHIALCKTTCFLDAYANQIIDLILHYEPVRLPLALEIIHEARCGSEAIHACAMMALETIFCLKPAGLAAYKQLQMQNYIETAGQVRYRSVKLAVPRCAVCRNMHQSIKLVYPLVTGGAPIGAGLAWQSIWSVFTRFKFECLSGRRFLLLGLMACCAMGCLAIIADHRLLRNRFLACSTRREEYKYKFPLLLEKLNEGWTIGSKPPASPYKSFWGINFME